MSWEGRFGGILWTGGLCVLQGAGGEANPVFLFPFLSLPPRKSCVEAGADEGCG